VIDADEASIMPTFCIILVLTLSLLIVSTVLVARIEAKSDDATTWYFAAIAWWSVLEAFLALCVSSRIDIQQAQLKHAQGVELPPQAQAV
jgi:hypothetical protein